MSNGEEPSSGLYSNPWFYSTIIAVGALMVVLGLITSGVHVTSFFGNTGVEVTSAKQPDQTVQTDTAGNDTSGKRLPTHPNDKAIGDTDAPVTITEYTDFQCPYCRRYSRQVLPGILERYVRSGKVYYRIRHFPLLQVHEHAGAAALASECAAEQGAFWSFKETVMANQSKLSAEYLYNLGETLEFDSMDQYQQCLRDNKYVDRVETELRNGVNRGVRSTPTVFVNDQKLEGAQPAQQYYQVIEAELESVGSGPDTASRTPQ